MKGDFTRSTFKKEKHYSSVRSQQGRLQTDADWNEAVDISAYRNQTADKDLIGLCGGPLGIDENGDALAGFLIDADNGELVISAGRYYVDGILVENEAQTSILHQPDFPVKEEDSFADIIVPGGSGLTAGTYLAFLDVWERHISALEDADIREVALGGPDTATRTQVVWQVRLMQHELLDVPPSSCEIDPPAWQSVVSPSTGQMSARTQASNKETNPCIVPALAGYSGLENQLYRVEVHQVISETEITIKWSRENGSIVTPWIGQDTANTNRLTIKSVGRDNVLSFAADDWIELTDDVRELRGQPGTLVRIATIEGNVLVIDPDDQEVNFDDFQPNRKIRRWDMPKDAGEIHIDPTSADNELELENGVYVRFEAGSYRTGDYWQIPARTVKRDIEWPRTDAESPEPIAMPPQGIQHHYCRLAVLQYDGEIWSRVSDCRRLFPPQTEMLRFFPAGGDGQEAMPGQPVPMPLQVAVANGQHPVAGALVEFTVVVGTEGQLLESSADSLCSDTATAGSTSVKVTTNSQGIASCCWILDQATHGQQVIATLLEIDGKPLVDNDGVAQIPQLRFNANLSVADQVAYDPGECADLVEAQTVQQAIDILCQRPQGTGGGCSVAVGQDGEFRQLDEAIQALLKRGQRDICICLLPGDHGLDGEFRVIPEFGAEVHLKITGCGLGSRLFLNDPVMFAGLRQITIHDVVIEILTPIEWRAGAIAIIDCSRVAITSCSISGFTLNDVQDTNNDNDNEPIGALLSITHSDRITLKDNVFEASLIDSTRVVGSVFEKAAIDFLVELFRLPREGNFEYRVFRQLARNSAERLINIDPDQRLKWSNAINEVMRGEVISRSERLGFQKLALELRSENLEMEDLYDALLDLRRAAIRTRPGLAVTLGATLVIDQPSEFPALDQHAIDDYNSADLVDNSFLGILSFYGAPPSVKFVREVYNEGFQRDLEKIISGSELSLRSNLPIMGVVELRGNQITRISVSRQMLDQLRNTINNETEVLQGLIYQCLITDNIFESSDNFMLCSHQTMHNNTFNHKAELPGGRIGVVIADTSIYVGNYSGDPDDVLRDISRANTRAANLEITIS